MPWTKMEDEIRSHLAAFDIPKPLSIERLRIQLSQHRRRGLYLHMLPEAEVPHLPCGMWIATEAADHIYYARGASALHQQNIILHEIGHMLCDHTLEGIGTDIFSDLDSNMIKQVLLRTRYSTPQEAQAEMVAALILEKAGWSPGESRQEGILGDLQDIFGPTRRG